MKRENYRIYILEFLLIIFLLLACVYTKAITKWTITIVLLVFMLATVYTLKNSKTKSIRSRQITILMSISGIIFIMIKYILGVFLGFYKSTVALSAWSVANYIIPYIVIILSSEIIRKRIMLFKSNSVLPAILCLVITVLLDISLLSNINNISGLKEWFEFVALILFPSIASNLLYNFVAKNFKEELGIIIYRIITVMYIYFISITPDIEVLLEAILDLVVPGIIYAVLSNYLIKKPELSISIKRIENISMTLVGIAVAIIVMLVSCKFRYCAIVIGSGSMTGTINKGDVIIYESNNDKMEIQKGDILIFKDKERKIVHRIIEIRVVKGKPVYYTKGDANQNPDDGYVTLDNVVGIYKFRIPYIGQITLGLNELFN